MKKVLAIVAALFLTVSAYAQIEAPVKWAYAAKKNSPTEVTVLLKATIDGGWHIYSQHIKDGGPVKTSFTFAKSKSYALVGPTTEPKPITKYEKTFGMNVSFFENEVVFQQKIKLKSAKVSVINGQLEYMTCNNSKCKQPEDVNFTIPLGK
ncbi:MAG: protein-disulfide reductase DsbD domain-containing protein [Bacteroidota bacterium]